MYKIVTTDSLQHSWAGSDKSYTPEEKSKEKKYNHEYYIKNKEKWGVKSGSSTGGAKAEYKEYTEGDSDFDDDKYSDENMIPDSDFYTFKNKDGRTVIIEEDMKWTLPAGVEVDGEMKKQLAEFEGFNDPSIKTRDDWFDAVNAIINKEKKMVSEKEHEATSGGKLKSILDKKSTIKHSDEDSVQHSWAGSDKTYTAEEKAKEKKYNHEYYMKHKEKWGVKSEYYKEGDSDFDESNYNDKNLIPDSNFYTFKNNNGQTVVVYEDLKWVLPKGAELDADMKKKLAEFKGDKDPNIKNEDDWKAAVEAIIKKDSDEAEFDIDAAAMDVIRGKYKNGQERKDELGEDYEAVQKRVNELMKEMGKTSSTKKEEKKEDKKWDTSKNLSDRGFSSSTDGSKKTVKHSYVINPDTELYHYGILGQRWGVRRYQNADGSLTAEGKKHYSTGRAGLSQQDVNTISNETSKISNSTSNASKSVSKIKKSSEAKKKQKEIDEKEVYKKVSDMSDKELREFLNRYDMEQRYDKIINENKKDIMDGSSVAREVLSVAKDAAYVTMSAVTIYNILKHV